MKKKMILFLICLLILPFSLLLSACSYDKDIEIRVAGDYVQWSYVGENTWRDLIEVDTIKDTLVDSCKGEQGEQGDKGEKGDKGDTGDKGDKGDKGDTGDKGDKGDKGDQGLKGDKGVDGKQVEFDVSDDYIKWHYVGENNWTNLIAISDLTPELNQSSDSENPQGLAFYPLDDGTYGVGIGNATELTTIVIPETYMGKKVTKIIDYGFYNIYGNYKMLKIIISNNIKTIGNYAFNSCDTLKSITIPNSVTSIGDKAFERCEICEIYNLSDYNFEIGSKDYGEIARYAKIIHTSLDEPSSIIIDKDNKLTYFIDKSKYSLLGCYDKNVENVVINPNCSNIPQYIFRDCANLVSITMPNSVTSIGDNAFTRCFSLKNVTISNSVTSIGDYAFYGCSSLTSITIPNSVTSIGSCAFGGCSSLTSITIPNSVTSISASLFNGCNSLRSVEIPNSVTSIGSYAFCYCSSLVSIEIPDSVTSIDYSAFKFCSSLTSITIPDSVKTINDDAFAGCSSITIYCEATSRQSGWAASWCSSWTSDNTPIYWYSATQPTTTGNYWHYVNGVVTKW